MTRSTGAQVQRRRRDQLSSETRSAAPIASGTTTSEPSANPPSSASQLSGLPPSTASRTAVVPKINTGTFSGMMSKDSSRPPR